MKNYARSNRNQARWQSVPVPLGRRRYSAPVGFQTITASPNARKPHSATGRADGLRSVPHQRLHPRTNPVRSVNLHWHTRSQTNTQTHPAYYPTLPIPRMAGFSALPQTHHPNAQQSLLGIHGLRCRPSANLPRTGREMERNIPLLGVPKHTPCTPLQKCPFLPPSFASQPRLIKINT